MITHDPALAARADRVMTMTAGELVETARAT
jgi:predicted ABC-type transport system involved in lysophospholipase L1 biosynthesis ATPase subunit